MKKASRINRRTFITTTGMAAAGTTLGMESLSGKSLDPLIRKSDPVRVGFIGLGNRGTQLLKLFMSHQDVEVAAMCDVYEPYTSRNRSEVHPRYLEIGKVPEMGEAFGTKVKRYTDFRRLLERKDHDSESVATYFSLSFDKRPEFELFDIRKDPDCLDNLIGKPEVASIERPMKEDLLNHLTETEDPRVTGPDPEVFESYPRFSPIRTFPNPRSAAD